MKTRRRRNTGFLAALAVAAAAWLSAPTASHASLIFDFTITGFPNAPGIITGEIDGLTNNASNQVATQVIIDSISGIPELFPLPFGINTGITANAFNVQSDQIISADFIYHNYRIHT